MQTPSGHRNGLPRRLGTVLLALSLGGFAAVAIAPPSTADVTPAGWQEMATPGVDASSELTGISCLSTTDCTAVGYDATTYAPLVTHYDGNGWTSQTLPVTDGGSALSGVSCPAAGVCTAVGYDGGGGLIMQESGGVWTALAAPYLGSSEELRSVSCADATDCVAAGTYYNYGAGSYSMFSLAWTGGAWNVVWPLSPGVNYTEPAGIDCFSATDCILVGYYSSPSNPEHFLAEHYDGSGWSTQSVTDVGTTNNELDGLSCLSDTDCTAVGYAFTTGVGGQSVVEHWDGTSWTQQAGPSTMPLVAVSCVSANDCVASGSPGGLSSVNVFGWNGSAWSTIDAPGPGRYQNMIGSLSCPATGVCFGVGYRQESASDPAYPLINTSIRQPQPVVATARNTGATTVVLTGSGFDEATAVSFDGVSAPDFTVDSDTQITVTVPDGAPAGDITVTTPNGTSVGWFADRYVPLPVVSGVSPGEGSDQGGDTVTVTGSGFTGATEVYFDTGEGGWDAQDFTVDSDSQITAITPESDWDGTVDVRVTGPGGTSATAEGDEFTFGTSTAVTLDADQWIVYPNETATLSAIVDPIPNDGTVTFADGSGPLCQNVAVDPGSGIATCPVSYPSVRHATITATYSGAGDYLPSSASHEFVVDQQPTTATLTYGGDGGDVTYTMTVTPTPDAGTVTFTQDNTAIPGCAAVAIETSGGAAGTAQCAAHYTQAGRPWIDAAYSGDANYSPAVATVRADIVRAEFTTSTGTAVAAQPASPTAGTLVRYTAIVTPVPDGGAVAFAVDGDPVTGCVAQPVDTTSGTASCLTVAGAVGPHTVTATYSGDLDYDSSQGSTTVTSSAAGGGGGPQSTSATLGVSDDPTAGQPVTYTLTVAPVPDDGTVAFADGGNAIPGCASLDLHAGVATCTTTYSMTGQHTVVAGYSGNGSYSAATARATVTIGAPASKTPTTTTLQAAPHSAVTGQVITLSATVDPAPDGGTVEFDDGGNAISGCGAVTPDPQTGVARCQPVYGDPGAHAFTASYSGDTLYGASTSAEVDVTVTAPSGGSGATAVTTTLGVSPAHPAPGDTVTYTASLDPAPDGGTVTFTDAGDPVAHCSAVTISDGQAQCVTSYDGGGTHTLTASYSGDAGYAPSTSGPLTVTVQTATTTAFTTGPTRVNQGDTNTYTVTVTPVPSGGTVAFTDGSTTITGCGAVPVNTTTGKASCSIAFSSTGAHTLTATYSGATGYLTSSTTQTVTVLTPVTVYVSYGLTLDWQFSYTASYQCGGVLDAQTCTYPVYVPTWDVTLIAQVQPSSGPLPNGLVVFGSAPGGSGLGCTAAISSGFGSCTITTVDPGAPAQVTGSYLPDATHTAATSAVTEVDLPYPSTTTVSASTTAPTTGQSVTLTAKVTRTLDSDGHTAAVAGGGTLSFTDGGAPIAGCTAVPLSPGTCTTSFTSTGAHQVQAAFSGTSTDATSSAQVEVDVTGTALVPPSAPSGVTNVQSAVSTSATGTASASSGGVSVAGSGAGALTLGQYPLRPKGVTDLTGKYFDLKLARGSAFRSVSVRDCNLGGATRLYFWTGTAWVAASNQVYDGTSSPPCVTVTISAKTTPSLAQLTGTVFGSGPAKLRETPTLSATSTARGRVTVTVATHPAVAGRMVTVYRVVKRHGHKATLVAVGHARTGTAGRVTLRLTLPAGSTARLRARMSGTDYVEALSAVATVHVRSRAAVSRALIPRAE